MLCYKGGIVDGAMQVKCFVVMLHCLKVKVCLVRS